MYILGISCYYHDAAACLLKDGKILAAAQEERFTRKKHDSDFPHNAIQYCLKHANVIVKEIDYVGFYDKPFLKFERILSTYISTFPKSFKVFLKVIPLWLKIKLWIRYLIRKELGITCDILFVEHHLSHAGSSFLVSPFKEAAILTVDGVGEWATATYGVGRGNKVEIFKEIRYPDSLGLLYSAFTYYLGFRVNSAEYKVMGLAPYGKPRYAGLIKDKLIDIKKDGSFKLNMDYFAYNYSLTMINKRFEELFGGPPRKPESEIREKDKDIASSIQKITEEVMVNMARHIYEKTGMKRLCMAGGVALNCVANAEIMKKVPFEDIFIQPASGDAGGAIGVASFIYHSILGHPRNFVMGSAYLGPEFTDEEIRACLLNNKADFEELREEELIDIVSRLIAAGKIIGWFQGRMEFGPRALGNRSILADARDPEAKKRINQRIKFREIFRPFAPTILDYKAKDFFNLDRPSPFMLLVADIKGDKKIIPSATHVDGTARVQTISRKDNTLYYDLVERFYKVTQCPVIINTSFNVRGEPIVCTPQDAYNCFMKTGIDVLAIGKFLVKK